MEQGPYQLAVGLPQAGEFQTIPSVSLAPPSTLQLFKAFWSRERALVSQPLVK